MLFKIFLRLILIFQINTCIVFSESINNENSDQNEKRVNTKLKMMEAVEQAWSLQKPFLEEPEDRLKITISCNEQIKEKLNAIFIPKINFNNMPLSRVVQSLSDLSVEYDSQNYYPIKDSYNTKPIQLDPIAYNPLPSALYLNNLDFTFEDTLKKLPRGINIILIDPKKKDPTLTLMLREVNLEKILKYICQLVNYQYDLDEDTIILRPIDGQENAYLKTCFFPLSRATVIQLTGFNTSILSSLEATDAPLQPQTTSDDPAVIETRIRNFFQRTGVDFKHIEGASLAFDGIQLIVTQTPRNLERIHNILKRYSFVKQVEIEAKFMEVQQGVLEELGFQWDLQYGNLHLQTANSSTQKTMLRSLGGAFTPQGLTLGDGYVRVANPANGAIGYENTIANKPPAQPNAINIGMGANNIANLIGIADTVKVQAMIRALEQHTGTDLMSAPRVTVLSGKTAEIVVAQELRYPNSYGDIDSAVGSASLGTSSAGVTITAGTPHDFKMQRVGVQMTVTPSVEEDNKSISLCLEPKVTEFEGFVEYGGMSVAISGNTSVNVPAGFFQPIFSVRQIKTEVTIYDGATVVMGGLTREEVKEINDKVPFLGDIPVLGRFFKSKGQTSQKKNLLIFVTASLVSPRGMVTNKLSSQPLSNQDQTAFIEFSKK